MTFQLTLETLTQRQKKQPNSQKKVTYQNAQPDNHQSSLLTDVTGCFSQQITYIHHYYVKINVDLRNDL